MVVVAGHAVIDLLPLVAAVRSMGSPRASAAVCLLRPDGLLVRCHYESGIVFRGRG